MKIRLFFTISSLSVILLCLFVGSCESPCVETCQHENSGCANGSSECDCECFCHNAYEGRNCTILKTEKLVGSYIGTELRSTSPSNQSSANIAFSIEKNPTNVKEFFIVGHPFSHGERIRCVVDIYDGTRFELPSNTYTNTGVTIGVINGDNLTYSASTRQFSYTLYYQGALSLVPLTIRGTVVKQ